MKIKMFNFYYHIPSAMIEGKWNLFSYPYNNEKYAGASAIVRHYRGMESPEELIIWIKRKSKANNAKVQIRRFRAVQNGKYTYDLQRVPDTILEKLIDEAEVQAQ